MTAPSDDDRGGPRASGGPSPAPPEQRGHGPQAAATGTLTCSARSWCRGPSNPEENRLRHDSTKCPRRHGPSRAQRVRSMLTLLLGAGLRVSADASSRLKSSPWSRTTHETPPPGWNPLVATFEIRATQSALEVVLHSAQGGAWAGVVPRNRDYPVAWSAWGPPGRVRGLDGRCDAAAGAATPRARCPGLPPPQKSPLSASLQVVAQRLRNSGPKCVHRLEHSL